MQPETDRSDHHLQIKHDMQFRILQLPSDIGADDIDFLLRISQLTREDGVGERFQTFRDLEIVPSPHRFLREKGGEKISIDKNIMNETIIPSAGRPAKSPPVRQISAREHSRSLHP